MKPIYPSRNYVVFDFETSGLVPSIDHVIQMSAIKFRDGQRKEDFNLYVKLGSPLNPKITELTGITDQKLADMGISEDEAFKKLYEYIEDLPLIGHNSIQFDRLFLEKAFQAYQLPIPDSRRHIDTAMIYKATKLQERPFWHENHFQFASRVGQIKAYGVRYKLVLCCEELKIDVSGLTAHQSDSDVEMTNLVYTNLINSF